MSNKLDPDVQSLIDTVANADFTPINLLSPEEARRQYLNDEFETLIKPIPVGQVENFTIDGPGGALPMRLYRPSQDDGTLPVVVYFHGGGFVIGGLESYDGLCRLLCERSGCLILSVDYRLAPEHRFPAAVDDAFAALAWTFSHAAEIGGDPSAVAVAGDSAGGSLAAVVCHLAHDGEVASPAAQVLIYPAVDLKADFPSRRTFAKMIPIPKQVIEWFNNCYLDNPESIDDPRASPIRYARFEGLPPALVLTAGFDPLRDEGKAYADKLRDAGVPVEYRCYDGLVHGFVSMGGVIRAASDAVDVIAAYLSKTVRPAGA
ncbi:MAG: alpha/beta hydrolase [Alphaproteobacteria bacterium]|nr:alpha/beta hydrolase [Alphaproteobacteria bacterium]